MPDFNPDQIVRIQLERSQTQDAIARAKKIKREKTAILPTFIAENGKVKRLGQDESRAAIATNLHYGVGEEMRSIPVRGGLSMVDNKNYLQPQLITATSQAPPEIKFLYKFIINNEVLYTDAIGNTSLIDHLPIEFIYPLPNKILDLDQFIATNNDFPYFKTFNIFGSPFGADFYADPNNNYNEVVIAASGSPSVTASIQPFIQFNSLDSNGNSVTPEEPLTLDFELLSFESGTYQLVASAYGVVFSGSGGQVNLYSDPQAGNIGIYFYVRFKSSSKTNWFEI